MWKSLIKSLNLSLFIGEAFPLPEIKSRNDPLINLSTMKKSSFFNFHGCLKDFLAEEDRRHALKYSFESSPAIKDAIEAIGVPHPEIGLIVAEGEALPLSYLLKGEEDVHIYPHHEAPEELKHLAAPLLPVREGAPPTFIVDVHLGRLARYLRVAGIDTLYENEDMGDEKIAHIASIENRIVLTRDVGLLKRSAVEYGHWMRNKNSRAQLREVVSHYSLKRHFIPFSRCVHCNGLISPIEKSAVEEKLPPGIRRDFKNFFSCTSCSHVYWKGSHYKRILELLKSVSN